MQASELRIGNILKPVRPRYAENFIIVESIGTDCINADFRSYNLQDIKPVPVTHERLIEIGFKYRYGVYIFDHDFELELQPCKEFLVALRDSDCEPLLYVHEIQNLFFALYRKELPCQLQ